MTGDARAVADFLARAATRLEAGIVRAEEENGRDAIQTARLWTGGTNTESTFRRLDRPYAKRHGTPKLDPRFVNRSRDDGDHLQDDWRMIGPREESGDLVTTVDNTNWKAQMLQDGTPKMFARRPDLATEAEIAPRVQARRQKALEEAFR